MNDIEENIEDEPEKKRVHRDDQFRCKVCLQLWDDAECILDEIQGYLCPKGCLRPYKQPDYETPFDTDQEEM